MKNICFCFILSFILTISLQDFANAQGATNPYNASTAQQHIRTCDDAPNTMQNFCSRNTDLELAQQQQGLAGMFNSGDQGAGQRARDAETNAQYSRASLQRVRQDCRAAFDQCNQVCTDEANRLRQEAAQAAQAGDQSTANQKNQDANSKLDVRGQCQQEQQTLDTQAAAMDANLAEILAAVAGILQQLGLGQGDGSASLAEEADEDDPCNGEYAHLLIECKDDDGPSGSRAGLSGVAALNGRTSGGSGNLFDGAQSGEPGGEGSDNDDSAGGGNPFGGAGMAGGAGLGGSGLGNGSGKDGGGKEGLDTDINKGFMGTGGFGGGGGGGGGSRGGRGGYNPASPLGGADGVNKAALQKKLDKYSKDSSRKPASLGGANGPFDDNWAVIKKAYKKNSSSMFHQQ